LRGREGEENNNKEENFSWAPKAKNFIDIFLGFFKRLFFKVREEKNNRKKWVGCGVHPFFYRFFSKEN
jgi:hypothetical protein